MPKKKHALILANTVYRDGRLSPLAVPGQGHAELAEALKDPARGGFSQVETVLNGNLSQILHAMDRFFSRKPAEDLILVYFSGHGVLDAQGEIFLALRDSDRYRLKSTALMAAVLGMNMDICASPHKVLVLDCRFHAPFLTDNGEKDPPRIHPDKLFAGRGLPKVIFSASDIVSVGNRAQPSGDGSPEFTHLLTETLRAPASAAGKKPAFTLEDWWNAASMPIKAAGGSAMPTRHIIGKAPDSILRGIATQKPEMAMAPGSGTMPALVDELSPSGVPAPDAPHEWTRMSGIFPLEMIAPEYAHSPEVQAPVADSNSGDAPQAPTPAPPAPAPEIEVDGDLFAKLRARVEEQEEEDRQAYDRAQREEAAQRERLAIWKAKWEGVADAPPLESIPLKPQPPKGKKADPPHIAMFAEMQKTMFMEDEQTQEMADRTMEMETQNGKRPSKDKDARPDPGDGLATIAVSREEFLEGGAPLLTHRTMPLNQLTPTPPPATMRGKQPPSAKAAPAATPPASKQPKPAPATAKAPPSRGPETNPKPSAKAAPPPSARVPETGPAHVAQPFAPSIPTPPPHPAPAAYVVPIHIAPPTPPTQPSPYSAVEQTLHEEAPSPNGRIRPEAQASQFHETQAYQVSGPEHHLLRPMEPETYRPGNSEHEHSETLVESVYIREAEDAQSLWLKRTLWLLVGLLPIALGMFLFAGMQAGWFAGQESADPAASTEEAAIIIPAPPETPTGSALSAGPVEPADRQAAQGKASPAGVSQPAANGAAQAAKSTRPSAVTPEGKAKAIVNPYKPMTFPKAQTFPSSAPIAAPAPSTAAAVPSPAATAPAATAQEKPPATPGPRKPLTATSALAAAVQSAFSTTDPSEEEAAPERDRPEAPAPVAADPSAADADAALRTSVQDAMRLDSKGLKTVYERFALGFPGLSGDLLVNLKVDPTGRILDAKIASTTTGVNSFDQEILRRVAGWRLVSFQGKRTKLVSVPLHFQEAAP